jgi:hypothetical protein
VMTAVCLVGKKALMTVEWKVVLMVLMTAVCLAETKAEKKVALRGDKMAASMVDVLAA